MSELEKLRAELEKRFEPIIQKAIDEAVKPWKRAAYWALAFYAVLIIVGVVQVIQAVTP